MASFGHKGTVPCKHDAAILNAFQQKAFWDSELVATDVDSNVGKGKQESHQSVEVYFKQARKYIARRTYLGS